MSLILEALRKSEIERRRTQTPDLYAEPALATRNAVTVSPRWLPWALAAVTIVLLAGWLVRGLWSAPMPSAAAESTPAQAGAAPSLQASEDAVALGNADAIRQLPAPVAPGVSAAPTPVPAAVALPVTQQVDTAPIAVEERPADPAPRADPVSATPAAAPMQPPAPMTIPTPATGTTLRLADLSSEERGQLPTLKMSMHLWDAESAQRFVILDGERVGEGDRIGEAVVDEITRDGVVLAWQGRRLKLPIQ